MQRGNCLLQVFHQASKVSQTLFTPHTVIQFSMIPQTMNQMADVEKAAGPSMYVAARCYPAILTHVLRGWQR